MNATAPISQRYNFSLDNVEARAIAKLPKAAQEKLDHLRDVEVRLNSLRSGLYDAYNLARENLGTAQRDLARFDKEYPAQTKIIEGQRMEVPLPEREPLVSQVERFKNEMARIQSQQIAADPGFTTSDLVEWIAAQPAAEFALAAPVKVAITGSLADTLASIRAKQAELKNEIIDVTNAPMTTAEAKAKMRAEVAATAAQGSPGIAPLFHNQPLGWPNEILRVDGAGVHPHTSVATVKNAFALTVWLAQDALVRRLEEDIDAVADDTAISATDRGARISQLNASLLLLERQEEAVICKIEQGGGAVTRKCQLPEVLLGIS